MRRMKKRRASASELNANVNFWMAEKGSCPRKKFTLIQSGTPENTHMSNKTEIIVIINLALKRKNYPQPVFQSLYEGLKIGALIHNVLVS